MGLMDIVGSVGNMFSGAKDMLGSGLTSLGGGLSSVWDTAKSWGGVGVDGLKSGLGSLTSGVNWVRDSLKGIGDSELFKGIKDIWNTGASAFKEVSGLYGPARATMGLFGLFGSRSGINGYAPPGDIQRMAANMGLPPGFGNNPGDRAFMERLVGGNQYNFAASSYADHLLQGMMIGNTMNMLRR